MVIGGAYPVAAVEPISLVLLITARSKLRKLLFLALSVTF